MGKKRIHQLLTQMKENQQADLRNAAAIYTVAQVAVNKLEAIASADAPDSVRAIASASPAPALPAAMPTLLTQAELLQRYGSYNGCRSAAQKQGIHFSKSPSWPQLIAAFSYADPIRQRVQDYVQQQAIGIFRVRITVTIE
jgi:hypothetical protein